MWKTSLLSIVLVLAAAAAFAEPRVQSSGAILAAMSERVASEFRQRGEDFEAQTLPIDSRLRLPECERPLEAFFPSGRRSAAGFLSVGVRCSGSHPWTVYGKVRVRTYRRVTVLRTALRPGNSVGAADVGLERREVSNLGGDYLEDPDRAVGYFARRMLAPGSVLRVDDLAAPKLVSRGQQVTIRAQSTVFEVSTAGVALADGQEGERIRVRNGQSQRVIEGTVAGPGLVVVGR